MKNNVKKSNIYGFASELKCLENFYNLDIENSSIGQFTPGTYSIFNFPNKVSSEWNLLEENIPYFIPTFSHSLSYNSLDINDLSFVVHFELPDQLENYIHRSGRTGRAGKLGLSIAFIESKEIRFIRSLEKELGIKFHEIK